ncbi:hypothetical protein FRB90_000682 [Tulasnella sp. 427]|nr:hypothetical protein FRB90_000682 [Tulasnella sp. 427]
MFDMAVPFLEKMLDDMPVSPEDLKAYPDLAEKRSALIHWNQNKEQALLLLRAMHKAYLNVMVGSETEAAFEPNPLQPVPLASESSDRERTLLATDRTPSPELDTRNEPPVSQTLNEQAPYPEPEASASPTQDFVPVEETQKPGPDLEIEASHGLVILPNNFPPKGSDDRKRTLADRSASLLESGTTDVPLASRILDEPTAPHETEVSLSTPPPIPKISTTATRASASAPPKKVEVKPEKGKAKAEPWTRGTTRRGKDDGFWTAYGYGY